MSKLSRPLTTVAALLVLTACHAPARNAPPPTATSVPAATPAPLSSDAAHPAAYAAAPADDDRIPLGPMFPPASSPAPVAAETRTFKENMRYWVTWFKDAFPAGESRTVRFHNATDADDTFQIRRNQPPEELVGALSLNTQFPERIQAILHQRNNNDTTKFLALYLTATNPKLAASTAEVVIENIFYGDRSGKAKCLEIGNDFEAIIQYGYYDGAVAARREYLQARLDQQATRARKPRQAATDVTVLVGVPVGLFFLATKGAPAVARAFERAAIQRGEGLINETAVNVGRAASRGSLIDRLVTRMRTPDRVVADYLKSQNLPYNKIGFSPERMATLRQKLGVTGELPWVQTGDSHLRVISSEIFNGVPLRAGERTLIFELKDGINPPAYASTHFMSVAYADNIIGYLKNTKTAFAKEIDSAGVAHLTDIPASELVPPHVPNKGWAMPEVTPGPLNANPGGPKAFPADGPRGGASIVDEVDAAPAVGAAVAARTKKVTALVTATGAALSILGAKLIYTYDATEEEKNLNALYIGGEIGNSVQPHPAVKAQRP